MNSELNIAWQLVQNTGCNVFLTGKAGTGKTTFLREFCKQTHKRNVVLAPTGIAAINAQGSTLHSFFQLPFGPYIPGTDIRSNEKNFKVTESKRRMIRSLDLVVIDEISMVRADLLDCVDAVLRRYKDRAKPFGGVQLLLIGDLQQLAPVAKTEEWNILREHYATPYFFSSKALQEVGYVAVELKQVYRQSDQHFIDLLNKIRTNETNAEVLRELNNRFIPDFHPAEEEGYIRLMTHNAQADQVNARELEALDAPKRVFDAEVWKEFPESSFPTPEHLELKVGAQVMFVKNDSSPRKQYFNGMLGVVVDMGNSVIKVKPHDEDRVVEVMPEVWENTRYTLNEKTKDIEEELVGTYTQFPLKTAWAITVHKSQGLTFERAIIDVQHSFSHGQTYVALSRCKSLEGMVLNSPIPASAIIIDHSVMEYTMGIERQVPTAQKIKDMERAYFISLLSDAFTFVGISAALSTYRRHVEEHFYKTWAEEAGVLKAAHETFRKNVETVSVQFSQQYQRMVGASKDYANDPAIQGRCVKGAEWFLNELTTLTDCLKNVRIITTNKSVGERLVALKTELDEQIRQKRLMLAYIKEHGFAIESYLRERNMISLAKKEKKSARAVGKKGKAKSKSRGRMVTAEEAYQDILGDMNSYVGEEEIEGFDYPDLSHEDLPY